MPLVVFDDAEAYLLDLLMRTDDLSGEVWHLHLYQNDFTPLADSVLADFFECNFSGYDVIELTRADWSEASSVGGIAQTTWGTGFQQWLTTSGSQDVYGYYITTNDDLLALWGERFATKFIVTTVNPVLMLPTMRLHSEYEPT